MHKLIWLVENCHTVSLECNDHRSCYRTVTQEIEGDLPDTYDHVDAAVLTECKARNVMHQMWVYPDTPIGSYHLVHYDVEALIDYAYRVVREERGLSVDAPETKPS